MPLLQVHMAGQDPEERVQVGTCVASPWPAETMGVTTENLTGPLPLRSAAGQGQGHSLWRGGGSTQELPKGARIKSTH